MQTKTALLASSAVAALTLAAPANAASNFYVSVFGGANWLQDDRFAGTATTTATPTSSEVFSFDSKPDTGFIVGGAVGMSLNQFMQGLRTEVEVAYRQQNVGGPWVATITTTGGGGPTTSSGTLDYDQSSLSVMANVWYDFDVGGVSPYIGGGIGWAETELDGNFINVTTPGVVAINLDDNGFAWQLGAGVNFDIAPNMKLGVGYRYFEGPEVAVTSPIGGLVTRDVESQNHSVLVNLTVGL